MQKFAVEIRRPALSVKYHQSNALGYNKEKHIHHLLKKRFGWEAAQLEIQIECTVAAKPYCSENKDSHGNVVDNPKR